MLLYPIRVATSPALLRTYLRTALVLLTSTILFGIAVIAYSTFYYTYIPVRGIEVPVYLQFDHFASLTYPPTLNPPTRAPPPDSPDALVERAGRTKFPYGIANVNGLVSRQKYDVVVEMVLPRSDRNLDAGNWMVGLEMRGPGTVGGGVKNMLGWGEEWDVEDYSQGQNPGTEKESVPGAATNPEGVKATEKPVVLARSRRPAILTYRSPLTELAYRVLRLPLYVIGWGQEAEDIRIKMMEAVEFEKGWRNVPASLRVELRSRTSLEVYKVAVRFVAKLEGLRWFMYHYRLSSFVLFTGLFWSVEICVVLITWGVFSLLLGGAGQVKEEEQKDSVVKVEDGGAVTPKTEPASSAPSTPLSDTSRTFPTLRSQQPLHYSSSSGEASKMKAERNTPALEDIPAREEAEADDEDEDADFILEEPVPNTAANVLTDSGIGTSLESSREAGGERGLVRRRSEKRER